MERADVERWIEGYRRAWASDAPDEIAELFTDDATYSPFPWPRAQGDWKGRDEIVAKWIERGESGADWRFDHEILAVEDDTAVIAGKTYYGATKDEPEDAYANVFLVRFAPDGRAREFAEWDVQRPREGSEA
jgi:uncharacterized protein (TIGR02246 family)